MIPNILSIVNEKGGSGKSTLAINLAMYQSIINKQDITIVDTDPQKSIATFQLIRNEENLPRAFKYIYKQGEDLKTYLNSKENKNLIIDTGGRDAKEMRIALINSDIVVIPTTPSQFDLSVLDIMIDRVKMAKEINEKLQVIIVINRVNPNPFLTKKIDDIKTYIKELECNYIKLANTIIYERERYKNSISNGQSVIEADTQDKAYQEIQNLSLEIFK
ncbi:partitioning protein, ParA family [Campylobacter vicugnae]|uniref:Partitioning protein, ParA family n=1 Tax=Campylobacter vicugnae TaxID=1660076 RepID=A0A1X9T0N7_9BACT|nr:ParA family protein [Campylobacter sp. RM8964]ARR02097.1 partitioning protein, ParA family [Campylobacter sp. RM8964]